MMNQDSELLKTKLKEAEDKYKALFELGPIGVAYNEMIYDQEGNSYDFKFLEVNENFIKFMGIDPSGKTMREAFPEIEYNHFNWINKFGEVAKTGKSISFEQFLPINNRWYNLVAYQYLQDHFIVVFLDITESKIAQLELNELNSGMKSVFDASSRVSIIRTDVNGTINLFNKGAEKLLGYSADEIIGKKSPLIFHKESEITERSIELTNSYGIPIKGFSIFKAYAEKGKLDEREWTYIQKDGTEKKVTLSITAVKNSKSEITGFLGTAVDISDRKDMEEKLRDSENLFRSLFEESADAFLLIENNKFIDCNRAAVKMFNAKNQDEIKAHHPSTLSPDKQPDGRDSLEKADEMIATALTQGTNRFEWDHQKIDGIIFPTEVLLTKINIGNKILLHTCIRDITDRKKAEEQLRQSQKMEVVGQLAGGVAHDFNNMLSGIIGATEVLQMELNNDPKYSQYTNIIINAAERASDLTQQLLAFGRKSKHLTKRIDINDIIVAVKDILTHTINKNIVININLSSSTKYILGDPSQIQNVLLNLCVNARDAMPKGGELSITSSSKLLDGKTTDREGVIIPKGSYIEIKVKDTGEGIPRNKINKIFEPFYTTKELGQGTGLGLASVYGTIKSHNSFLLVESKLGDGTTFTIFFPEDLNKNINEKSTQQTFKENFSGKVLVIDDEHILRNTIKVMLESLGLTVILAENGVDGIKKYSKYSNEINLVILDMIMPQLNGRECYNELAKINKNLKTIIISGYAKDDEISDLLTSSNIVFLHKPFRKKDLVEIVNKLLNL